MFSERIVPQAVNTDLDDSLLPATAAKFIKNLVYSLEDTSDATGAKGNVGVYKTLQNVEQYFAGFSLPAGENHVIGAKSSKDTNEVFVFNYNSLGQHLVYRINGDSATISKVYQGPLLNFQLEPQYFIHVGGATVTVIYVANPATGEKVRRTFLQFTDGFNPLRFICVEDAIKTQGFNESIYPFFIGNYNRELLISAGVSTPHDCIGISELPLTDQDKGLQNTLLYNTWQFRVREYDVWGRPSEYGIISDPYIPGGGSDCISQSSGASRCLSLSIKAPSPYINQLEIAYRNCNETQWRTAKVLDLWVGSPLGDWWTRPRNPDIPYADGRLTYTFCANKGCDPIDPADTNRLYNPLPRITQAVATIGKFTAVGNNQDQFLPFSKTLKDAFTVTVEPPTASSENNKVRSITVWVTIYNDAYQNNQPVYERDLNGKKTYFFGNFKLLQLDVLELERYKQYFIGDGQKGFTGYLRGTGYYTTSKQYFLSNTGVLTEVTDFSFSTMQGYYNATNGNPTNPDVGRPKPTGVFLQKFEFNNVPAGKYIFSIANHQVDPAANSNWAKTSTYVIGAYPLNVNLYSNPIQFNNRINDRKEEIIDVCEANYDGYNSSEILMIADLFFQDSDIEQGYILNTNVTGSAQHGVELLRYEGGDGEKKSHRTDHNGFYFTASTFRKFESRVSGYCNGAIVQLFPTVETGNDNNAHPPQYRYLNDSTGCPQYEYQKCNYVSIKGKVVLCNSGAGVPGLSVVLSRGGSAITNEDGEYTIIAYDSVVEAVRQDALYFITNSCAFDGCDGGCIATIPITINKPVGACTERVINVADTQVGFTAIRGLLSDSTRSIGVVGWDWLDRPTWVQPLGDIVTPSVIETKIFAPSAVRVTINPAAIFPAETKYITFFIGEAAGIEEYVTWIIDKLEFVDNSGAVNNDAPTQIKIYYKSLVEYSKQNNYNTNVNWQFIPEGQTRPVLGDRVQFLLNGDGSYFPKAITSIVKYDETGVAFLINYTNDLKDLKENAIIRLVRPKACTTKEFKYELCKVVTIQSRKATEESFYLNAYDTYYVNRQVPVPNYTDGDLVPSLRVFGVPFESNSPSDFWGAGCHNIGRINIENPEETVLYHEEQIALSSALSETGMLNYLNYFSDDRKTNFDQSGINGIVGMYPQSGTVLVLGQSDSFTVGFNDNVARINEQGQVMAPSIENQFGRPQSRTGSNYGCLLQDKSTIAEREGLIHFLDTKRSALLQHNYDQGIPISINGAVTLIREKCKSVQQFNLGATKKRYFVGSINPINSEYLLSDFLIGSNKYVNQLRDYSSADQETHAFGIYSKVYRGNYMFTPQNYAFLDGDLNDTQLFSFLNGIPYRHYRQIPTGYGTVYGVSAERIIRLVMSMDSLKKKLFQALAVYCKESMYFVDQAISETGQTTMMLKTHFRQANFGWFAPFLCDLNTLPDPNRPKQTGINKLMDGDTIDGTYVDVRFIGDPEQNQILSKLHGFTISVIPQEPSGEIK